MGFNFMLRVEALYDVPCKSVRAFTREMEYEYIQEGGLNDYVHMRRKPISRPFTFEVERYAAVDIIDPLPIGAELILPVLLFVSRHHNMFIPGVVTRTYVFTGCTVTKKEYGKLDAERSELLTETVTIAYREMVCIDIPFSDLSGDAVVGATRNVSEKSTSRNTANVYTKVEKTPRMKEKSNSGNKSNQYTTAETSPRVKERSNSANTANTYSAEEEKARIHEKSNSANTANQYAREEAKPRIHEKSNSTNNKNQYVTKQEKTRVHDKSNSANKKNRYTVKEMKSRVSENSNSDNLANKSLSTVGHIVNPSSNSDNLPNQN